MAGVADFACRILHHILLTGAFVAATERGEANGKQQDETVSQAEDRPE